MNTWDLARGRALFNSIAQPIWSYKQDLCEFRKWMYNLNNHAGKFGKY
jgi:hypothetical protein